MTLNRISNFKMGRSGRSAQPPSGGTSESPVRCVAPEARRRGTAGPPAARRTRQTPQAIDRI